jgi:hypothetical protein
VRAVKRAAVLTLFAAPAAAFAADPPEPTGAFKLGPAYLTPRLLVRSAGVDTNVFNSASGEVSDTSAVISPGLAALLPVGRRLRLSGDGNLDLNYFRREDTERSTDVSGDGRADLYLGPVTFFAGGGAGRLRQRFSIEVDERLERRERRLLGGVVLHATRKLALTAEVRRSTSTYEAGVLVAGDDVKESLDRRSLVATLRAEHALTDQTTLVVFARRHDDRFLSDPDPERRQAESYTYAGGFQFGERAVLTGAVLAGVREYPAQAGNAAPPFTGLYLDVSASTSLRSRARVALNASRDVLYAVNRADTVDGSLRNSYVSRVLRGELSLELPFRLIGRGSLGQERARYLLPYEQDGEPFDREDRVLTYGVGLLRAFGRAVRVGGTAQWSRRTSNLRGFGYSGLRYGLSAEVTP